MTLSHHQPHLWIDDDDDDDGGGGGGGGGGSHSFLFYSIGVSYQHE